MGEPPVDRDEFARWRTEADAALRGARLQADALLHNWACFAAEQAAQLGVKGLLHGLGRGPWGHDLVRLGEQLAAVDDVPDAVLDALRRLSRHYIPARYPDAHPSGPPGMHDGKSDSAEALADAASVLGLVDATWERLSRSPTCSPAGAPNAIVSSSGRVVTRWRSACASP
jgi:HEPN domain-containing protein